MSATLAVHPLRTLPARTLPAPLRLGAVLALLVACGPELAGEASTSSAGTGSAGTDTSGDATAGPADVTTSTGELPTSSETGAETSAADTGLPQGPDFGDHTPMSALLLFSELDQGFFALWWDPTRTGDLVEGEIGAAQFIDGLWQQVGPAQPFMPAVVEASHLVVVAEDLTLPAGTHPFGPDAQVVTVTIDGNFIDDEQVCGVVGVELDGEQVALRGFIARPLVEVVGDPHPPPICD